MRRLSSALLLTSSLAAGEYDGFDFDAASFEKRSFAYRGYLRSDNGYGDTSGARRLESANELNLRSDLDRKPLNLHLDASLYYRYGDDGSESSDALLNAVSQRFGDEHAGLSLGKEVLRWGKGYAYSPLAFFERPRELLYPERSREGYWMVHAQMTRTFAESPVANATLSLLALPQVGDNAPLLQDEKRRYGAKLYLLAGECDIDLVLTENGYGADLSANAAAGLELHGEYASGGDSESWLFGLRYQSATDLTVIAEYAKTFDARRFSYLKATRKDPFGVVYSTLYVLLTRNFDTDSFRFLGGGTYDFKNGFTVDAALLRTGRGYGLKTIVHYYF
jgi:hypothetical protein